MTRCDHCRRIAETSRNLLEACVRRRLAADDETTLAGALLAGRQNEAREIGKNLLRAANQVTPAIRP